MSVHSFSFGVMSEVFFVWHFGTKRRSGWDNIQNGDTVQTGEDFLYCGTCVFNFFFFVLSVGEPELNRITKGNHQGTQLGKLAYKTISHFP